MLRKLLRFRLACLWPRRYAIGEPDRNVAVPVLEALVALAVRVDDSLVDNGQASQDGGVPLDNVFLVHVSRCSALSSTRNPPNRLGLTNACVSAF